MRLSRRRANGDGETARSPLSDSPYRTMADALANDWGMVAATAAPEGELPHDGGLS